MILGIGCDLCDINRIAKLIESQGDKFLKRIFLPSERERLKVRTPIAPGFAKVYAAKEALVKALGDSTSISWQDIEVVKNAAGRPEYILRNTAYAMAQRLAGGPFQIHLSLSDEFPYAMAYAIFCKSI
jgi:holo-[acyl-carrier protein] synthase